MNIFDSNNIVKEISIKDDLTIVIVTHNRIENLELLTNSLAMAFKKHDDSSCDIVFCINGKDLLTYEYLKVSNTKPDPKNIQIITLDKPVSPAEARNIATASVHTEWVLFLDDDVEIPPDLFYNFKQLVASDPQASLWGGPNLTPEPSTSTQKKIGWLLQNYLVTGPISCRYKLNNIKERECKGIYFSLCNIFIKTKDFRTILFNAKLKTAEENELIYKLAQNNKKMKTSDLLYVWHYRRSSVPQFLAQIKNYGFGRGQLIYNGIMSTSIKAILFLISIMAVFFVIKYTLLTAAGVALWLIAVFVKLKLDFRFEHNGFFDIMLPVRLWFNYISGIVNGYSRSYRINKNSNLR